ncbi:hypothetical protein EV363DRAFT_1432606 [Boletus edulis]|nr:hypothetical protein EV363DRAFT_1268484 [Boletus edulis]KAF8129177.1 hypothetical protein EV363DRAFT_1432606 [Boletus edulis]
MTESNQPSTVPVSVSKENKAKKFYEHGKDALGLALSVANMQEEKTLRKVERHHQPQVGKPRPERNNRGRARDRTKRLEEVKVMITERRADVKKEKAKSRKEPKGRVQQRHNAKITTPEDSSTSAAPRKRVSFA